MIERRKLLLAGAGVAGIGALGVAGFELAPRRLRARFGLVADPYIPDAPEGHVTLTTIASSAMGTDVDLFTAVPAGHGDGRGLPVVVILHGASASASALRDFGLARFLTAAVEQGTPPFVLAGTDDGPAGWVPAGDADPQGMLLDELPDWLSQEGFDADRRAVWGWSRGGHGALRLAQLAPTWGRAVAMFSPAISAEDADAADLAALADVPLGIWCGEDDSFIEPVRQLVDALPVAPEQLTYGAGGHTREYWNDHTLDAFAWLAGHL